MKAINIDDQSYYIRLPAVSRDQKATYMRAAAAKKMALTEWMLDVCDKEALKIKEEKIEKHY